MLPPERFAVHSAYSDPGAFAHRLRELPDGVAAVCAAARGTIAHYRAELADLPVERRHEVDLRWLARILALDAERHSQPLTHARPLEQRVAGCCRDHTLFVVGALRERGVPARSRVGFAGYFSPGYHHDHVVVEHHDGERWVRTDPELDGGHWPFDPRDVPTGAGAPFASAAEVWRGHRAGELDASAYGVFPGSPFGGPEFVRGYVVFEVAHRFGDELLLWDAWGATEDDADPAEADALADEVADLLVRSDDGDGGAESELLARYTEDDRLHPGASVVQHSPFGADDVVVDLTPPGRAPAG
ncbi:transglutaminase domain-containing protein [Streptomyces sp. NP160]|uniref:transglutaminase domain-containing protein n=1 Tax=Streptomyces sp. NP160 TaxID=2586637 RepID=UPI00111A2E7F|nr:transglutaminase domain-containing protein [Streptomyces sp. NP160]TNM68216.1 transglutaminase domain-containing protein [Streptomyces sp. NP160]